MTQFEVGEEGLLVDHLTLKRSLGWVFFCNTNRFLETGDHSYVLVGNDLWIGDQSNEEIHQTATSLPIDELIRRNETGNSFDHQIPRPRTRGMISSPTSLTAPR